MVLKTILDYYERLCKEYPNIPEQDIKRICQYGFKSLYLHNSYGGDVLINRRGFWFYCGQLMNDSLKYFNYYKRKMAVKLRVMYKRLHIDWDGYYYFALSKTQFDEYLALKNKKGRPRKNFTFNKVVLYKIYDECNITESGKVAIFRVPIGADLGFTLYKESLTTGLSELILQRDPLKLSDILLSNYKFEYLNG